MNSNNMIVIMKHASVFSGIGGPEVAASMLGWENVFHCDINKFGRKVLEYHYPNSVSYEDSTKTDFSEWEGKVDVLTGGFPCQPFSYAGKRRGSEDDRYLWPYMLRCIEQVRPTWFVGENVAGITTMAFPGEDVKVGEQTDLFGACDEVYEKHERYVLDEICENLERAGYSVQPMLIPACAVGAPHRRDRVFIVAHRNAEVDATERGNVADTESNGGIGRPEGTGGKTERPHGQSDEQSNECAAFGMLNDLMPTPRANKVTDCDLNNEKLANRNHANLEEEIAKMVVERGLMPTPRTCSSMGAGLESPLMSGHEAPNLETIVSRQLVSAKSYSPKNDGEPFRLSPLFTEEMMGFPSLWVALPFLSANGSEKV